MNDNFNLRKYLVENKATTNSKMVNEDLSSLSSLAKYYLTLLKAKYPKNLASLIAQYVADPANGTPAPKSESDLLNWAIQDIKWNAGEEGIDMEDIDKSYIQALVAGVESMIPSSDSEMINENSTGLASKAAEEFLHAMSNGVSPAEFIKAMFKHYREYFGDDLQEEGVFYEYSPEDEALLKAVGEEDLLA